MLFEPGTRWKYSDAGPNWLAECLTLAYRRDMNDLLFERVFSPIGIGKDDLVWRKNQYRPHEIDGIVRREFGSGISANVEALSRFGYLYLREGRWRDQQILPKDFVKAAGTADPAVAKLPVTDPDEYGSASKHYGLLWWNNADGTLPGVPRDAFWTWGLYDSLVVVMPSLDVVVVRTGKSWKRDGGGHYAVLEPFLRPIAESVEDSADVETSAAAPYPPSPVIASIEWAPPETIRRAAPGSDNWPMTWGSDDRLYTAYGDGWGFGSRQGRKKLSLGLSVVTGGPDDWKGSDLAASSFERTGNGPSGEKASGLLMVDGVLYALLQKRRQQSPRLVVAFAVSGMDVGRLEMVGELRLPDVSQLRSELRRCTRRFRLHLFIGRRFRLRAGRPYGSGASAGGSASRARRIRVLRRLKRRRRAAMVSEHR